MGIAFSHCNAGWSYGGFNNSYTFLHLFRFYSKFYTFTSDFGFLCCFFAYIPAMKDSTISLASESEY